MKQIVVNVVCITVSLLCVIIIIEYPFRNEGGFGLENFIGVMATFIGICATMMVGLQIYNHLEIRDISERVKNLQNLENEQRKIIRRLRFAQKGVSDLFRLQARIGTDDYVPVCLAVSVISAAYEADLMDEKVLDDVPTRLQVPRCVHAHHCRRGRGICPQACRGGADRLDRLL